MNAIDFSRYETLEKMQARIATLEGISLPNNTSESEPQEEKLIHLRNQFGIGVQLNSELILKVDSKEGQGAAATSAEPKEPPAAEGPAAAEDDVFFAV